MTTWTVEQLENPQLAKLLNAAFESQWSDDDGAAALRYQLAAPLCPDILGSPGPEADRLRNHLSQYTGPKDFGGQLLAKSPSAEILLAIKRFAKTANAETANPLSRNGATVLYFAAIAASIASTQERISHLTDDRLRQGFLWARECAGAEALTSLFEKALALLPQP